MKKTFFSCLSIFIISLSALAQNRLGLVLVNGTILQAKDTISLLYPSDEAIIICELFDADKNVIGRISVKWSVSGNLTVLDNIPMVSDRLIIETSQALFDQRGYLSAQASDSTIQWINNKVFIKIKGKNSGVLRSFVVPEIQNHSFRKFDIAGRMQKNEGLFPSCVVIMRDALEKERKKAVIIK